MDVATELDWDHAVAVPAVNTAYTATKSGIVLIRAQRDTSYQLGILVYGPNMDGSDTGSNYIAGAVNEIGSGKAILSTLIPKGCHYMCYLQNGATFLYGKFVPFKNAIANS